LNVFFQELEIEQSLFSECFREVVRWNGAELHNIAAAIAGVASQVCATNRAMALHFCCLMV
jgi:hypothetical protein